MHVRRVSIDGTDGIHHVDLQLAPVTVLVGPNGVGKTRVLKAVQDVVRRGLVEQYPEVVDVRMVDVDTHWLFAPSAMAGGGADRRVGLAGEIARLLLEDPARKATLLQDLTRLVPAVRDLHVRPVNQRPGTTLFSLFFDFATVSGVPQEKASFGTLALLNVLVALQSASTPTVVLIDDIDLGLHPRAQQELARALLRWAGDGRERQFVIVTHSPFVVAELEADHVYVLGHGPEGTVARRLDEHPDAARALKGLSAGEFWGAVGEDWVASP